MQLTWPYELKETPKSIDTKNQKFGKQSEVAITTLPNQTRCYPRDNEILPLNPFLARLLYLSEMILGSEGSGDLDPEERQRISFYSSDSVTNSWDAGLGWSNCLPNFKCSCNR